MTKIKLAATLLLLLIGALAFSKTATALTADRVYFEVLVNRGFKVRISYTIPELQEKREAYRVFASRAAAVKFFEKIQAGADFYLGHPHQVYFTKPKLAPNPW